MALLEVRSLRTEFHTRDGVTRAVRDVSFRLERGESLGIVGESGSGKSVAVLSLLGLVQRPPAQVQAREARFDGVDLMRASGEALRRVRGRRIGMIFQDPMTSLNPYLTIGDQLAEPLLIHGIARPAEARRKALAALENVGVPDARRRIDDYPHQFSGGMRQRAMIAMALIAQPEILIADEPTTALDVTVQAQILDLLDRERRQRGVSVILISHDLGIVADFCDRVMVMYAGRVVESGPTEAVFASPQHPYTRALHRSRPAAQGKGALLPVIPGLPPDLVQASPGCAFAPRCEFATDDCSSADPELAEVSERHASACLRIRRKELALP